MLMLKVIGYGLVFVFGLVVIFSCINRLSVKSNGLKKEINNQPTKDSSTPVIIIDNINSTPVVELTKKEHEEDGYSIVPEIPFGGSNQMVKRYSKYVNPADVPTDFDHFDHLNRTRPMTKPVIEAAPQNEVSNFKDTEVSSDVEAFVSRFGFDSKVVEADALHNYNRKTFEMDIDGEEVGFITAATLESEMVESDDNMPIQKEIEKEETIYELFNDLSAKKESTTMSELEKEIHSFSMRTDEVIELNSNILKMDTTKSNPLEILGIEIPKPLQNEVVEKGFLDVVHSTFFEGTSNFPEYDEYAHIQPVFPTSAELEEGKYNRYLQMELDYVDLITHKIIDDAVGLQTWVCELIGFQDQYLHVFDGTTRAWLNAEDFGDKGAAIGDIMMVEINRTFDSRYHVETLIILESYEMSKVKHNNQQLTISLDSFVIV